MPLRSACLYLALLLAPAAAFAQPVLETAFSPDQGATDLIVRTIDGAHVSVEVAAYQFTSRPIAAALVAACNRHVAVRVVADARQASNRWLIDTLGRSCVTLRINDRYNILHDKFIVVDSATVETGSFNFTRAAETHNAENVLVIHDAPAPVVQGYAAQWQKLWDEAEPARS